MKNIKIPLQAILLSSVLVLSLILQVPATDSLSIIYVPDDHTASTGESIRDGGNVNETNDELSIQSENDVDDGYSSIANGEVYQISDWYDLNNVRNNLSSNFVLMNDLDKNTSGYDELASPSANGGKGWKPIGIFTGNFDGQGYEIRDLFINRSDEDYVGLFGYVAEGGVIKGVGVVNATVTGNDYVGGLVGEN